MDFIFNDGGRAAAGFKGSTGDCVCRSIAIITGKPYKEVYDELNRLTKDERVKGNRQSARTGISRKVYEPFLKNLGYKWIPTMRIGQGCRVHLADGELPMGKLVVRLSKHLTAVIDGVIHDTHDPQRNTLIITNYTESRIAHRCVYGYFIHD